MTTPYSGSNFWRRCHLLVSPESYWFDNLGIFTEGNLLLHCISNLPLGVTNEGREAIKQISGVVAEDSSLQDRGVAHYLLPLLFSLVSLLFIFCFRVFYHKHQKKSYFVLSLLQVVVIMSFFSVFKASPEIEISTFRQENGENLKKAWDRHF